MKIDKDIQRFIATINIYTYNYKQKEKVTDEYSVNNK